MKRSIRQYTRLDDGASCTGAVTELGDGLLDILVVAKGGHEQKPGKWSVRAAKQQADKWAKKLLGRKVVASRWNRYDTQP